jgi:hypothetical protein
VSQSPERHWRMSLDFGPAVLALPGRLSVEDLDDLERWLAIVARQTRRAVERRRVDVDAFHAALSEPPTSEPRSP